jgi:hypothetical protein
MLRQQILRQRGQEVFDHVFSRQMDRLWRLPVRMAMLGNDGRVNAAAHVELGAHAQELRLDRGDDVVQDLIGHRFMKSALIAKRPDIQFQRLEFDAGRRRHIFEADRRKIGLPGLRAQTGELGDVDTNRIVPAGLWVDESFEVFAGFCTHY